MGVFLPITGSEIRRAKLKRGANSPPHEKAASDIFILSAQSIDCSRCWGQSCEQNYFPTLIPHGAYIVIRKQNK